VLYHLCSLKDWDKLVFCIAEPKVFQNLWPGSYGLEFSSIPHRDLLRNLWPESRSIAFYNGTSISIDADSVRPETLDSVPIELGSNVAWAIAEAFAARARELQLRAFATATAHGKATNEIRKFLQDKPALIRYRDLVFGFVYLAELAAEFALSRCQFKPVGSHQGLPILRPRDSRFRKKARKFLESYTPIHSYLGYLAEAATSEGWSGQMEDEAYGPDKAWQRLKFLAYGTEDDMSPSFIKTSDLGDTKETGADVFLIEYENDNGKKQYRMFRIDADGTLVD
jgi:hypothetical protein